MVGFEDQISNSLFSGTSEKTFIDKLLGRQDVESIRELVKKPELTREETLELLYMLSSGETKLFNYGEWDRYVIMKYFVWIREFVVITEMLYDYEDDLKKKQASGQLKISKRTKQLLKNNSRHIQHNVKFLVDLYFQIARSSLSLGGTGFLEILKNKYEISYPQGQLTEQQKTQHNVQRGLN